MASLNKEQLLERAEQVFGLYPASKEWHFTADGQAFSEKSDAANHAKSLEVKETVLITKGMIAAGIIEVPSNHEPLKLEGGAKNEFQKLGAKSESGLVGAEEAAEKAALAAKYEELSGKKPATNIGLDKLKAKVQELEDAKAAEAAEAAEAAKAAGSSEGKTENPE
jgi:hypothetical protein